MRQWTTLTEEQIQRRNETEEAIQHWDNLMKKLQERSNRAEAPSPTEKFPEIDWKNSDTEIESQGWTQYGDWNDTSSQDLMTQEQGPETLVLGTKPHDSQEPTAGDSEADWFLGTDSNEPGRTTPLLGTLEPQDHGRDVLGTTKVVFQDPLLNELIEQTSADDNASTRPGKQQYLAATQWAAHLKIDANILLKTVRVLVDSGACGNFMDPRCVQRIKAPLHKKRQAVPITGLNGEKLGPGITHETQPQSMIIGTHFETIYFDVSPLGGYDVVLGMPWLTRHNPIIE